MATLLSSSISSIALGWQTSLVAGIAGAAAVATDPQLNPIAFGAIEVAPNSYAFHLVKLSKDSGSELWNHQLSGTGNQHLTAPRTVAVDAAGDVIAAGHLDNMPPTDNFTVFKVAGTNGALLWRYAGPLNGDAWSLALDSAGNAFATGSPFVVVKLDATTGVELWRTPVTGTAMFGFNQARGIAVDSSGNVFAVGKTYNGTDLGTPVFTVVKLAGSDGTLQWRREITGTGVPDNGTEWNDGKGIGLDASGDVIVVGSVYNTATSLDFAVIKLKGSDGTDLWRREIDSNVPPSGNCTTFACRADLASLVAIDPVGDVLAAGATANVQHTSNFTLIKMSGSTGNTVWRQDASGGGLGLAVDGSGNVVALTTETIEDTSIAVSTIAKRAGTDGALLWSVEPTNTALGSLAVDASTNIVAAGSTYFGAFTVMRIAGTDGSDAICGDGAVTAPEQCDDANLIDDDGCESDCTYTPVTQMAMAGGTVTTDPMGLGASPEIPLQAALTTPNAGTVSISAPTAVEVPKGFQVLGVQLQIEAPDATAADPLILDLIIDASVIPAGVNSMQLDVVRNGELVADCSGPPNTATPDPCVERNTLMSGDIELSIRTSHASAWAVVVQGLSKDGLKCVSKANGAGVKVAKVQAKLSGACLKNAAAGEESNPQACLTADVDAKMEGAMMKTESLNDGVCNAPPPFGFTSTNVINTAGQQAQLGLVADLFGSNLNSAVASDKPKAKCQAGVLKAADKLFQAHLKSFLKCKQSGLAGKKAAPMVTAGELEGCFDVVRADAKVGKARTKFPTAVASQCPDLDLATALPGSCSGVATCLATRVACRVCVLFNAMDGLSANCDHFDDGFENSTCP